MPVMGMSQHAWTSHGPGLRVAASCTLQGGGPATLSTGAPARSPDSLARPQAARWGPLPGPVPVHLSEPHFLLCRMELRVPSRRAVPGSVRSPTAGLTAHVSPPGYQYLSPSPRPCLAAPGVCTGQVGMLAWVLGLRRGPSAPGLGCAGTSQRLQENPRGLYHRLTYCCFLSDSSLVISSLSLLISFSS